jgi:hypothetical protein
MFHQLALDQANSLLEFSVLWIGLGRGCEKYGHNALTSKSFDAPRELTLESISEYQTPQVRNG